MTLASVPEGGTPTAHLISEEPTLPGMEPDLDSVLGFVTAALDTNRAALVRLRDERDRIAAEIRRLVAEEDRLRRMIHAGTATRTRPAS